MAELGVAIERTREPGRARASDGEGEARASTFVGHMDAEGSLTRTHRGRGAAVEAGNAASMHSGHVGFYRARGGQRHG